MVIYINLDDDGYLTGWGNTQSNGNISIYNPDEEVLSNPEIFKYVDGELVKDEERQQKLIAEREENDNKPSELEELKKENDELAMALMDLAEKTLNIGGDV